MTVVVTGTWATLFLGEPFGPAYAVVPVLMLAAHFAPARSLPAVLLLGVASLAALSFGLPYGGLELVVPSGVVLGWAGRAAPTPWPGLLGVGLVAVPAACRDGFTPGKLTVCLLVFGTMWVLGRVVRHRVRASERAVAEEHHLATTDPGHLAGPHTRAERRRVADSAARQLRQAVADLLADIDALLRLDAPTREQVGRVRRRGAETVEELRRMLLLLRSEPAPAPPEPAPAPHPWRGDLLLAAAAALIAGLTLWRMPGWVDHRWLLLTDTGVVLALALRRTAPLSAALVLAGATAPLVAHPPADPDALLLVALADAAVVMTLANHAGRGAPYLLVLVGAVSVALGLRFGVDGTAFITVTLLLSFAVGRAWDQPDQIRQRAQARSMLLQAKLARATAEAVHEERLRIARDLHDATGHAVGVLLMQLSAAEAQVETDPAKARVALETARSAGEQARIASNPLLPALGDDGLDAASLRPELLALVDQWRSSGMAVTAELAEELPASPELAVTCYRVVQEALTNCAKHAPGAVVRVGVSVVGRHLFVEVEDTGATSPIASAHGGGLGLPGLRERVGAGAGHFVAGPTGDGGHRVSARLPLPLQTRTHESRSRS